MNRPSSMAQASAKKALTRSFMVCWSFAPMSSRAECMARIGTPMSADRMERLVAVNLPRVPPPALPASPGGRGVRGETEALGGGREGFLGRRGAGDGLGV